MSYTSGSQAELRRILRSKHLSFQTKPNRTPTTTPASDAAAPEKNKEPTTGALRLVQGNTLLHQATLQADALSFELLVSLAQARERTVQSALKLNL